MANSGRTRKVPAKRKSTSGSAARRGKQGAESLPDEAIPRARIEALLYGYRYMALGIALSTGAALVSAGIAGVLLMRDHTIERYFATDPAGRITKLVPLDQPYLTPQAVLQFSERALTSLLTFDGVNYKRQFAAARPYFTEAAIQQVQAELVRNGMLDEVRKTRAIVTTIGEGTPIIKAEGLDPQKGVYAWEVQMQIRMTIQTRRKTADGRYVALLRVERRKQTDTGQGVLITRVILQRAG